MKRFFRILFIAFIVFGIALRICEPLRYKSGPLYSVLAYPERTTGQRITDQFHFLVEDLFAIIPESLQARLGLYTFLDVFTQSLSQNERDSLNAQVISMYREMDADPAWRGLPSATGGSALGLLQVQPVRFHSFYYLPKKSPPKHLLIFFHGSLGNLKAYCRIWADYAETTGTVIACPSQGFGDWSQASAVVEKVLANLPDGISIPSDQIVLAGLSAGGYGAGKEALQHTKIRGLIFISADIPQEFLQDKNFIKQWSNKPILVFYGGRDALVTKAYSARRLEALKNNGLAPKSYFFPTASHFLLLTDSQKVLEEVGKVFN